jgi:non-specific protein-tyrosine kinase
LDNEIKEYAAIIWHWAWLIILGTLVAGGVAYLYSSNQTPIYSASARLLIDEAPGSNSGNDYSQLLLEQQMAATYIELIRTRPVMEEVIERLDLDFTPGELSGRVSVNVPVDTQILVITVNDERPNLPTPLVKFLPTRQKRAKICAMVLQLKIGKPN